MKTNDNYTVKDPRDITFLQVVDSFSRMKISTLLYLTSIFLAYSVALFQVGCWLYNQKTAIALNKPFDIYLHLNQDDSHQLITSSRLELKNMILLQREYTPEDTQKDLISLRLRKIVDDCDTISVGKVIAQKGKIPTIPTIPTVHWFASSGVYAQSSFEWYGHENNYQFYEKFIARDTIRRYYDDGWILEYQIDDRGRSIPSTFRWIEKD